MLIDTVIPLVCAAVTHLSNSRHESRKEAHERVVRKLGLATADGERFFQAIYASPNRFLFRDNFRMDSEAFGALFNLCEDHIRIAVKDKQEVLAVALNWIGTAATCRAQEVLFDLAYSTVHRYRLEGVHALVKALQDRIVMPTTVPDDFIQRHPYFDQALCAIDGTHFRVMVPSDVVKRFRNHKGYITTNALIACDWNMNICFAYVGAEGSAHDSMVLQWSGLLDLIPESYYVLADAGYGLSSKVLTPYRSVRYHLKEWAKSTGRPRNGKELYNLRHAKARNVVERVIGVLKRRFKVLRTCMDYEFINTQAVIFACLCVHNFIRKFDESDLGEDLGGTVQERRLDRAVNEDDELLSFDFQSGTAWRDWMSSAMWTEYQEFRLNRNMVNSDGEVSSDASSVYESSSDDTSVNSSDNDLPGQGHEEIDIDEDMEEEDAYVSYDSDDSETSSGEVSDASINLSD